MSLKKEATEALKGLTLLIESLAYESKKKARAQLDIVTRFVGELRQEKSTLKLRTEQAEAESGPLREQVQKLISQLADVHRELDSTKQRLISTEKYLASTENHLIAAMITEYTKTTPEF